MFNSMIGPCEALNTNLEKKSTSKCNIVVLCCKDSSELVISDAVHMFNHAYIVCSYCLSIFIFIFFAINHA